MFTLPHLLYLVLFEMCSRALPSWIFQWVNNREHLVLTNSIHFLMMISLVHLLFHQRNAIAFLLLLYFANYLLLAHAQTPKKKTRINAESKLNQAIKRNERYSKQRPRSHWDNRNWMRFFHETMCQVLIGLSVLLLLFDFKWFLTICKRSVRKCISVRSLASQQIHCAFSEIFE